MARVVITAWGSYGDLFPSIGVGRALADRGHDVRLAVPAYYAPLVRHERLEHHAVGPDIDPADRDIVARVMDPLRGPEVLIREWLMPKTEETFEQLLRAAHGADLIVSHPVTFAAPVVARVLGVPWVSTALAPMSFFSITDPPVLTVAAYLQRLRRFGTVYGRLVRWMADRATRSWMEPLYRLRRAHGIADDRNPLMDGQFSPTMTLALFSPVLGLPQRDWPTPTRQTGFVFYNGDLAVPPAFDDFIAAGDPPVIFTLGSSAVGAAGRFYSESVSAARRLGVRAVLLTGGSYVLQGRVQLAGAEIGTANPGGLGTGNVYVMPGGGLQWIRDPGQLATKQSVLAQAGLRTDTWSTPVGDPDVFGLLLGAKP